MAVATKHVISQRRVIGALARAVVLGAVRKTKGAPKTPGPEIHATVPSPSDALVSDFVRLVNGDPSAYKKSLPPHLFPHWAFPAILRALESVPYPTTRIVNGGCTLRIEKPIPKGEALDVTARLAEVDDNGRRALIRVDVVTGTRSAPNALSAEFRALVPLGKGDKRGKGGFDKPRIADKAREIAFFDLPKRSGLDFAKATGDFNPIHWAPRYAKAMGFRSVILHGFGSMSFTFEGLARGLFAGSVGRIRVLDANFVRPLVLPARAGLYVWGDGEVGLGDAPGGPAYLLGRYEATNEG
jgi:hypothetical protein